MNSSKCHTHVDENVCGKFSSEYFGIIFSKEVVGWKFCISQLIGTQLFNMLGFCLHQKQWAFICSGSTTETLEKVVKCVQS